MIAVVALREVEAGKEDEYLRCAENVVRETRKEQGCISYECCRNSENAMRFAMIEKWENRECLDAHMQTAHFKEFIAATKDMGQGSSIEVFSVLL